MIIELKDCEAWVEENKTWILPQGSGYASPMMSYGAKNLFDTVNELIMPEYEKDKTYIHSSLHAMICHFWEDLVPFNEWIKQRNAEQIVFDMTAGGLDAWEIIECLYHVLQFDKDDKYSSVMIRAFLKYYNEKQTKDSAKVFGYEEILNITKEN
jgi:hypothetical protein